MYSALWETELTISIADVTSVPPGLKIKNFNVLAAQCTRICMLCMVLRRNTDLLSTQHSMPALTDAGPDCKTLWLAPQSHCAENRKDNQRFDILT
jgi:hypothetical protein